MKEHCEHTVNSEVFDSLVTCMPSWLMTSNAPIMLNTNWRTLLKLSSPILQEPSMRNTRSALAPLHTGLCKNIHCSILEKEKKKPICTVSSSRKSTVLFLPSQGAGIVGGGGGVGGSVGATVGFTTNRKIKLSIDLIYKNMVICLPKTTYECAL